MGDPVSNLVTRACDPFKDRGLGVRDWQPRIQVPSQKVEFTLDSPRQLDVYLVFCAWYKLVVLVVTKHVMLCIYPRVYNTKRASFSITTPALKMSLFYIAILPRYYFITFKTNMSNKLSLIPRKNIADKFTKKNLQSTIYDIYAINKIRHNLLYTFIQILLSLNMLL